MVAKLDDTDMTTEFGSFVLRRIEAIKNKPAASPGNQSRFALTVATNKPMPTRA